MNRSQVTFEYIGAVEALLYSRAASRAEATYHRAFIVGEGMTILVVLASKSFVMILTCQDWAFLRPFRLMGEHVGFQVLEEPTAVGIGTAILLLSVVIQP